MSTEADGVAGIGKKAAAPEKHPDESQMEVTPKKKLILKSCDDELFELDEAVAAMGSVMLNNIIDDGCSTDPVPLPNVTSAVLAKVVEYWKHNARADEASSVKGWNEEYVVHMDKDELFSVMIAANYLESKPLLDLTCQAVADRIKDMKVEEVRDYFDIEGDFTPEEEAKYREENQWAFQLSLSYFGPSHPFSFYCHYGEF